MMAPLSVGAMLDDLVGGCPEGGTIVLAWPGSAEEGLSHLRRLRQPPTVARTPALVIPSGRSRREDDL